MSKNNIRRHRITGSLSDRDKDLLSRLADSLYDRSMYGDEVNTMIMGWLDKEHSVLIDLKAVKVRIFYMYVGSGLTAFHGATSDGR